MIGVFDSGLGGVSIYRELLVQLPGYSYFYFGDNANAPYGDKSKEQIYDLTLSVINKMFSAGCEIIILACNTASVVALRKIQKEVLPYKYEGKKVLGIFVPTIENITGISWMNYDKKVLNKLNTVAILATSQTVSGKYYSKEVYKRASNNLVIHKACPGLVELIEKRSSKANKLIVYYLDELKKVFLKRNIKWPPNKVLLGCTHYNFLKQDILNYFKGKNIEIYNQPKLVAKSLIRYLEKHQVIEQKINKDKRRVFMTSKEDSLNKHKGWLVDLEFNEFLSTVKKDSL